VRGLNHEDVPLRTVHYEASGTWLVCGRCAKALAQFHLKVGATTRTVITRAALVYTPEGRNHEAEHAAASGGS
jgi:hypothetical protein